MKRMHNFIYIIIVVATFLGMVPLASAQTAGEISATTCKTGVDTDDINAPTSIRSIETYFHQSVEADQSCKTQITLQHNIDLRRGLVFEAPTSGTLVIDGNGKTLKAHSIPESDVCVLTIQGNADFVEIRNLKIEGNGTTPLDGICIFSSKNQLLNVEVRRMGRRGIVLVGSGNLVGASLNGARKPSIVAENVGPGIYVTQTFEVSSNKIDADTVLVQNGKGMVTTTTEAQTTSTVVGQHPLPIPQLVPLEPYEIGQQIYVVGDQTRYEIKYKKSTTGEVSISNSFLRLKSGQKGVSSTTVLLILDAQEVAGSATNLSQALLGVITPLDESALQTSFPGIPNGKRIGSINTNTGQIKTIPGKGGVKFSGSQIYLLVYPQSQSVASSTGKIDLSVSGTGTRKYCFASNKRDLTCEEDGPDTDGDFDDGGIFDDDGDGTGGIDTDGDGEPDAVLNPIDKGPKLVSLIKQEECEQVQQGGQSQYSEEDDIDGDGIASALEDSDTPDCEKQGNETIPYLYDSDFDGLGDGEEDADHNGYVNCKIVSRDSETKIPKVDEEGTTLVPLFRGTTTVGSEVQECTDDVADCVLNEEFFLNNRIPVSDSLGLKIGYGNWEGIPKYVMGTDAAGNKIKKLATIDASKDFVVCSETDPRKHDSDGDGLTDGEEARKRFVDFSEPAYLYDVETRELYKPNNEKVKCDDLLESGTAFKALRSFVARKWDENARKLVWTNCRVGNPVAEGGTTDFDQETDVEWGETNPRLADSDFDGQTDPNDACPNTGDDTCEAECGRGWKSWQINHIAGIRLGLDADENKRKEMYNQTFNDLTLLIQRTDVAAKDELQTLLSKVPNPMQFGNTDNDNVPDLIEAGLPEIGTTFSDCPDSSAQFANRTSPFATWTDEGLVLDLSTPEVVDDLDPKKVNLNIEYNDHNDPCPGSATKVSVKKLPLKDIGCMVEKAPYIGKMPLAACYYDRDNDGLYDCEEDLDGDGIWDKNASETNPLKFSSNNSGLSDQAIAGHPTDEQGNPLNPLTDDTDGDGIPDAVEIAKGGTADFYDPVINVGKCNPDLQGVAVQGGEQFWTDAPQVLKDKGIQFIFALDTDPFKKDTDGDGIDDGDEMRFGYSPINADSDDDGLCDGPNTVAAANCVGGEDIFPDGDFPFFSTAGATLSSIGTLGEGNPGESNPCDPDTDRTAPGDGIDKCKNVPDLNCQSPNAIGTDQDSDGVPDYTELTVLGTDPFQFDTDKDNLSDGCARDAAGQPIMGSGESCKQMKQGQYFASFGILNSPDCGGAPYQDCDTNPLDPDTDDDTLSDNLEVRTSPISKDTDGDCISDGLEDTHFRLNADGTYTEIPGSRDGLFVGCNDVATNRNGIVGKVCTETDPADSDTDKDGLADGNIGGIGEDLDCSGTQNLEVDTLLKLETSPLTFDSNANGRSDFEDMTRFGGGFNLTNIGRAVAPTSGNCTLVMPAGNNAYSMQVLVSMLLIFGLPLVVLMRTRWVIVK